MPGLSGLVMCPLLKVLGYFAGMTQIFSNAALWFLVTAEQWDRIMGVNARGPFLCYKYAGIQMIKQGRGGRIIGASSVAGKRGELNLRRRETPMLTGYVAVASLATYSASKFAVRGLTQAAGTSTGVFLKQSGLANNLNARQR